VDETEEERGGVCMAVVLDADGPILFNRGEKGQFHVWVGFTAIDGPCADAL